MEPIQNLPAASHLPSLNLTPLDKGLFRKVSLLVFVSKK
jgi:hypothetical protein